MPLKKNLVSLLTKMLHGMLVVSMQPIVLEDHVNMQEKSVQLKQLLKGL